MCAIGGDRITPFDPINDLAIPVQRPGAEHWFGTDDLGRGAVQVMAGARDVLIVSFIVASVSVIVGSMLGLIMGYVRGVRTRSSAG